MKDYQHSYPGRTCGRTFWAITDENTVARVKAVACHEPPAGIWWVPELGRSMSKRDLFATRAGAEKRLKREILKTIGKLQSALANLREGKP